MVKTLVLKSEILIEYSISILLKRKHAKIKLVWG
ncbi:hypothetical protein SAMN04489761_3725 [Tenacibaculum sp. MAR_2009_124]|nr:hypothetical protein SAMN04489761_3725 [Tenacibaculum sp. MAR_2009_124]